MASTVAELSVLLNELAHRANYSSRQRRRTQIPAMLTISRERLDSPIALSLIDALNEELTERYPEDGANHFELDLEEVAVGRGTFLVASLDGEPAGCGALRVIEPGVAEIKRMYVPHGMRGRGIATALLAGLEIAAHELNVRRLVLETGARQPEAIALYRRAGFDFITPFGEYVGSPLSVCMGKDLHG
jgi:GNAT superfamily N-acetyltransferase